MAVPPASPARLESRSEGMVGRASPESTTATQSRLDLRESSGPSGSATDHMLSWWDASFERGGNVKYGSFGRAFADYLGLCISVGVGHLHLHCSLEQG